MFGAVLKYMWGVSLGRTNYISSLKDYKDLRFAGVSLIYAFLSIATAVIAVKLTRFFLINKYAPAVASYILADFSFLPLTFLITLLYVILWILSTLLVHVSAMILGARASILSIFITLGLSLPIFLLLVFTPAVYYLALQTVYLFFIPFLLPPVAIILWSRLLYKVAKQIYLLPTSRAITLLFFVSMFALVGLLILWFMIPTRIGIYQ